MNFPVLQTSHPRVALLTTGYLSALILIGFWSISTFWILNQSIEHEGRYADLIDNAGRQRILSQRTLSLSLKIGGNLSLEERERTLEELASRIDEMLVFHQHISADSSQRLVHLKHRMDLYLTVLQSLIEAPEPSLAPINQDQSVVIDAALGLLLELEATVSQLQLYNEEENRSVRNRTTVLLAVQLLILAGAGVLIVHPMAIRIQKNVFQLEQQQKKLESYNGHLEIEVQERTKELSEKNDELALSLNQLTESRNQMILQEKLASLGTLAAGLVHEIKNPLNFVSNFGHLCQVRVDEIRELCLRIVGEDRGTLVPNILEMVDRLEKGIGAIIENSQRAETTINHMLTHSRKDEKTLELVDLNNLLDEYLKLSFHGMRSQENPISVDLVCDYDSSLDSIEAYPQSLGRVFFNLINNAFFALQEKCESSNDEFSAILCVGTVDLGDRVKVYVRDNGLGIAQKDQSQVFDPFFTTKPKGKGTGLGLSLSFDIINNDHNGLLSMNSKEGEFAEFIIVLPKNC